MTPPPGVVVIALAVLALGLISRRARAVLGLLAIVVLLVSPAVRATVGATAARVVRVVGVAYATAVIAGLLLFAGWIAFAALGGGHGSRRAGNRNDREWG